MRYRTATIEDLDRLLKLYQAVARTEGGLARLEHEVTPEYIGKFLEKSLAAGLIIVGENKIHEKLLLRSPNGFPDGNFFSSLYRDCVR